MHAYQLTHVLLFKSIGIPIGRIESQIADIKAEKMLASTVIEGYRHSTHGLFREAHLKLLEGRMRANMK